MLIYASSQTCFQAKCKLGMSKNLENAKTTRWQAHLSRPAALNSLYAQGRARFIKAIWIPL